MRVSNMNLFTLPVKQFVRTTTDLMEFIRAKVVKEKSPQNTN